MQERLRLQQRALRMPRRARPIDLRMTLDRRLQQEARRMGVSPMALYQQRDFLKKQATEFTKQLEKAIVPAQIMALVKQIPGEVSQYMNIQKIIDDVTRKYNQQFDDKIAELTRDLKKADERIIMLARERAVSPAAEKQYAELATTIKILREYKSAGQIPFSDVFAYAKEVGKARGEYASDMASYEKREREYQQTLAKAQEGVLTQEILMPKAPVSQPTSLETPFTSGYLFGLSPMSSKQSSTSRGITDSLRRIFGF